MTATGMGPSEAYWEKRYAEGGNSGSGSYGALAKAKAKFLNDFIRRNNIDSVVDLGCGDGNQASLIKVARYTGVDVSRSAIELASRKLAVDPSKTVFQADRYDGPSANLSLSIDVVSHLVDNETYEAYLTDLFAASNCFVIIYSRNQLSSTRHAYMRHRKFTGWVAKRRPDFILMSRIVLPDVGGKTDDAAVPAFYVYQQQDAKVYPSAERKAPSADTAEEIARHKAVGTDRFDLVSVIFNDELPLLRIQAMSLARFVSDDMLDGIVYCINEQAPETCERYIREEVAPLLGVHSGKVRTLPVSAIGTVTTQEGWLTQQACKLEAAKLCASKYFLVLDAKHHFIRSVSREDFFEGGRAKKPFLNPRPDQKPWLEDSLRYFGLDPALADKRSPASAPPFTMHTATVRKLVAEIREREGQDLVAFFGEKTDRTTEFTLYYAYLVAHGLDGKYLKDCRRPAGSIRSHLLMEQRIRLERELAEGKLWCFSIHRRRLSKEWLVDRHIVTKVWTDSGLFENEQEALSEIVRLQDHFASLRPKEEAVMKMAAERVRRTNGANGEE